MNTDIKKHAATTVKLVLTAGLLWWLFHSFDVSWRDIGERWVRSDLRWLCGALFFVVMMQVFGFVRWGFLLKAEDVKIPWKDVVCISLIGGFFGALSVGVVGQDVARIFYAVRLQPGKKHATVLSIFVDRLIGLLGLVVLAAVTIPLQWGLITSNPRTGAVVWTVALALGGAVVGLVPPILLETPGPHQKLAGWIERLPFQNMIGKARESVRAYMGSWKICLGCLLLSVGVHLCAVMIGYCTARALGLPLGLAFVAGVLPVVNVAISIPITISGFGVREGLLVLFFQLAGLGAQDAMSFSLAMFVLGLVLPLVGGAIYVIYRQEGGKLTGVEEKETC